MVVPGRGVHATATWWQQRWWPSVTNVGTRPTVGGTVLRIETHVLGEPGEMRGELLRVAFLDRLREERRFEGLPALTAQITRDVEAARLVHDRAALPGWSCGLGPPAP
jgi:riboflavin kinase/FMN adenylyltransferase